MNEITDQMLHFLWTFIPIGMLVWLEITPLTGALAGLLFSTPREFIDQWHGWPIGRGKWLDLLFFTLGGAAAGSLSIWTEV